MSATPADAAPAPAARPGRGRRSAPPDPGDQVLAYMRKAGIAMLVASMIVDVGWQQWQGMRMQMASVNYRLRRRIDPPGPILAAVAISLLESSSAGSRTERTTADHPDRVKSAR